LNLRAIRNILSATVSGVESSRAQWSDARLDDLAGRVTELDNRLTERIDGLESRMDARFNSLDAKFDSKFDRLQQTLIVSMTSVMLAFAAQIIFG
jgi:hypothetical protein